RGTAYGVVRLWVDRESGAILRMEGFDGSGRLAKRFEVITAQKLENQWFLKTMRVESFVPETGKIRDRAYLEVSVPE
ncbi:MAG TPA: outer membrane lipoprotein-sorting protein, partial [Chthoniobacterales bacterium]